MYKLLENPDFVYNTDTNGTIARGTYEWNIYEDWLAAGNTPEALPVPSFADYASQFTAGLQQWMELTAASNAYDSVLSCVSYKDSGVHQFQQDALAMIAWRDALWKWASDWQLGFNGQLPSTIPTIEEIIAQAPQPETFGWVVHTPGQILESQAPVEQTS